MKRIILIAFACIPVIGFAQGFTLTPAPGGNALQGKPAEKEVPPKFQNSFTINGEIGGTISASKIYLSYGPRIGVQHRDSSTLVNGKFQFRGTIGDEPLNAALQIDHGDIGFNKLEWSGDPFNPVLQMGPRGIVSNPGGDVLDMYLEKGVINITAKDSIKNGVFTTSKINTDNAKLQLFIEKPLKEIIQWNQEIKIIRSNPVIDTARLKLMGARRQRIRYDKDVLYIDFIKKNPESDLSLTLLAGLRDAHEIPLAALSPAYYSLSSNLRNSMQGRSIGEEIEQDAAVAVGKVAPEFSQNDVNDQPVKLSSFRGKYVLLDFWASWCVPCRAENPVVIKAYEHYKDKNFTVLGVSLDNPNFKAKWLEAIQKDGLNWTQMADMVNKENAVAKLYGVTAIPENFLIDPSGKIIAKNLRGEELEKKLASLLH
jgi:peroxiredoxin